MGTGDCVAIHREGTAMTFTQYAAILAAVVILAVATAKLVGTQVKASVDHTVYRIEPDHGSLDFPQHK